VADVEELTGLDARFLYSETDTAHMHTLKIAVMDMSGRQGLLTPKLFVELLAARLDRLPALRRRVLTVPHRLGHPVWFEDADMDLSRHVHWRVAAPPGGDRELAAIVSEIAATQLPRSQPLWDLTVVDGLAGEHMAFVVKLHHSVADGGAAVAMLENAFVVDDDDAFVQFARPEPFPTRRELYRQAARSRSRRMVEFPAFSMQTARGIRAARQVRLRTDADLSVPFSAPRTSLNVSLDAERTYAMTGLDLDDLMKAKRAAGVTLNDVFLTLCGGALRRYLDRRGELPSKSLVAAVPLATRLGERRFSGNHVDNLLLPIGTQIEDPAARATSVHEAVQAARRIRGALGTHLFEFRAGLTPPHLYPLGIRLWARTKLADRMRPPINLVASNVAGPRGHLSLDGATVTALYSVGPILEGIGLNITAWSYVDRLYVSVLGCRASLPDPWALVDDLHEALADLQAALPA
jgi:diacylglycerol O-acyltransferase